MTEVLLLKFYEGYLRKKRKERNQLKRALSSKSEVEKTKQIFINDTLKMKGFSFKVITILHEIDGEKFVTEIPLKDNLNTYEILNLTRGKSATIEMQKL